MYTGPVRLLSLLAAAVLSLLLTFYPQAVMQDGRWPSHTALGLCLWGVAAGFVHGVGYVPVHMPWRVGLGPVAAWLLMLGAGAWMLV